MKVLIKLRTIESNTLYAMFKRLTMKILIKLHTIESNTLYTMFKRLTMKVLIKLRYIESNTLYTMFKGLTKLKSADQAASCAPLRVIPCIPCLRS